MIQQVLWRLFHIQDGINTASDDIKAKNKELVKLRKEHVRPSPAWSTRSGAMTDPTNVCSLSLRAPSGLARRVSRPPFPEP